MSDHPTISISAPGKVLLAGGYLVLDRAFTGLVFGLNARIHVHIRPLITSSGVTLEEIIVKSPQFREAIWEYGYRVTEQQGGIQTFQLRSSAQDTLKPNPFVETTLSFVLSYISTIGSPVIKPATITILADDDYYTQPGQSHATAFKGETFKDFGVALHDAHKTGLGSSAALVTALTAALLSHYLPKDVFSVETEEGKTRLHNLAQTAHCAAQGKVGSGFDVASAVYGSCVYKRFSPSLLQNHGNPGSPGFAARIKALVEDSDPSNKWDTEIAKSAVKVPKGVRLVMCDVDCGSQTPGMVKQVLAWRSREPDESAMLWAALHTRNEGLAAELKRVAENGDGSKDHDALGRAIADIRALVRDMSRLSGVPVEPDEQTRLLDALTEVDGVIGGVVPGAGGFDAIALLIDDTPEAYHNLQKRLEEWNRQHGANQIDGAATPTLASTAPALAPGKVSVLQVRESDDGIRIEDMAKYESWLG